MTYENEQTQFYIYDFEKKLLTKAFDFPLKVVTFVLSSSGNTLVVDKVTSLEIYDLRKKSEMPKVINEQTEEGGFNLKCCDDTSVAYNFNYRFIVYNFLTNKKQSLTNEYQNVVIIKENLYFGNERLAKASLKSIKDSTTNFKGKIVAVTATEDVVIAQYKHGLIVAWRHEFEVVWTFEVFAKYSSMRVIADKLVLSDGENEAVIYNLKSPQTTTVIAARIGELLASKYVEFEDTQITVNKYKYQLGKKHSYKLWLILSMSYYFDVATDMAMLSIYYSSENYLIFALSLILILTPNIIEVKEAKSKANENLIAKLLFVDHFLALLRDLKNPTYFNGKRATGKELSQRTAIETCIESIPQTLIALYYIILTENFDALPIMSLIISLLSASTATSLGLKLVKPTPFLACLFCYRFCEISAKVMILALCSAYIYPYFAFIFILGNIVLRFIVLVRKSSVAYERIRIEWFKTFIKYTADSFINFEGFKKEDKGFSLYCLIESFMINFLLLLVLQVSVVVDPFYPIFIWILLGLQLSLYTLMVCDEAHRMTVSSSREGLIADVARFFDKLRIFRRGSSSDDQV
jgi:hypothetical protein